MLKKLNSLLEKVSYHSLPLGILFLICTVLIASWFRHGLMYGGGDVGLPTYNPIRLLSIIKNMWWDVHAPGFPYPSALTAVPLYFVLSILDIVGMTAVTTQSLLFGALLFIMGMGVYFLFLEVMLPKKSKTLALIAAIFYMLNPYMMIQVWHRFVHTAFFLAALIPILTYIYIKIIKTKKFFWFAAFLIVSLIFSYIYGSLSFMIVIWIPIFIYSLWDSLEKRDFYNILKNVQIFMLVFISWLVVNVWWLYPFWTTGPSLFAQVHSIYASISTLLSLSNHSSMPMVLRGINPFYTFGDNAWVLGYDNFLMQIISWTIPLVTLVGIYSILVDKKKAFYIWILLFLIAILVSKGTAAPFGHPFLLAFSKSFLLGAFRNPFEKFGIIFPFAVAFIFPLGIEKIYLWLKLRFLGKKTVALILVSTLLILEFVVYPWPMWLGQIFGSKSQPAVVAIPESYEQLDLWIKNQEKSGRILHLPFATGDAITYSWEYGYNGVEPSPLLFETPSVSNGFGLDQLDQSLASINTVFMPDNFDQKKVVDILSNLSIRYIVLHKDLDWKARGLNDPIVLENVLDKVESIQKKGIFDDLVVYEVDDKFFTPRIFTADISNVLTGGSAGFSVWPDIYEDKSWPVFFVTPANNNEDELLTNNNLDFSATPTKIIGTPNYPLAYKENALAELPTPRFLPDSPFYFLILIKEQIQLLSSPALNRHYIELDQAGKRLSESHALLKNGKAKLADRIMVNYIDKFNSAVEIIEQRMNGGLVDNTEKLILDTMLARQKIVLEEINNKDAIENMKLKLSKLGLIPYYELKEEFGMSKYSRRVYRFDVQRDGGYEILFEGSKKAFLYQGNLESIPLQIDNEVRVFKTNSGENFLSLGVLDLKKGFHEISYNVIDSVNLAPENDDQDWKLDETVELIMEDNLPSFEFNVPKQSFSDLSFQLKDFNKNDFYRIDFEYWVKKGQGPTLQVMQNSDWDVKGERYMSIDKLYDKSNYDFHWNSASMIFEPRSNTTEAIVRIHGEPWNNCLAVLVDWNACQNEQTYQIYNRESNFVVRNISIKRLLVNDVFLKSTSDNKDGVGNLKELNLSQISPSFYEGKLILDNPTSLVFLTTFHPEWKLSLIKDGKTKVVSEESHFLINGYGNLWYLNEPSGEYKVEIEFVPQKRLFIGITFSLIGAVIVIILGFKFFKKRQND